MRDIVPCAQRQDVRRSEVARIPFGLADRDITAALNEFDQGEMNSLLTLREEGARAYEVGADGRTKEEIQLYKIDTIWDEIMSGVRSPRCFLKTDVQGLDTAVVLGAIDHLQFIHGI